MDYLISLLNILFLVTVGNKYKYAFVFGILVGMLWFFYAIYLQKYGLLISIVVGLMINIRNQIKWLKA
jgi:hypothetical protein